MVPAAQAVSRRREAPVGQAASAAAAVTVDPVGTVSLRVTNPTAATGPRAARVARAAPEGPCPVRRAPVVPRAAVAAALPEDPAGWPRAVAQEVTQARVAMAAPAM